MQTANKFVIFRNPKKYKILDILDNLELRFVAILLIRFRISSLWNNWMDHSSIKVNVWVPNPEHPIYDLQ